MRDLPMKVLALVRDAFLLSGQLHSCFLAVLAAFGLPAETAL